MTDINRAEGQPEQPRKKPRGPTCSIPEAGWYYFGLGRAASYAAAKRGTIPVIKDGERYRAIVAKLDRMVSGE
jgi:hypothetical protein